MTVRVLVGDALSVLRSLPAESVQCVVTSPPYFGLRAYGTEPQTWPDGWRGELGSEPTPALFIEHLVSIFDEVRRVLRKDGLCFVNLGDSYSGSGKGPTGHNGIGDAFERQGFNGRNAGFNERWGNSPGKKKQELSQKTEKRPAYAGIPAKNLLLVPQRFAIAMQERGWICRQEIAWCKRAPMPESAVDRFTSAWEPIFMFSKQGRYYFDQEANRQPSTSPEQEAHNQRYAKVYAAADAGAAFKQPGNTNHLGMHSRPGPGGANLRNFWLLSPEPSRELHYASYPTEIPRRCILAGTSEKGACPACGAPWVRVVEREAIPLQKTYNGAINQPGVVVPGNGARWQGGTGKPSRVETSTLGWQPSCSCPPADPVPCVVLDPFLGSGTTAMVADRLGRDAIGIELNTEYAEMARRRIEQDAGTLFADPVAVEQPQQIDLFGEVAG